MLETLTPPSIEANEHLKQQALVRAFEAYIVTARSQHLLGPSNWAQREARIAELGEHSIDEISKPAAREIDRNHAELFKDIISNHQLVEVLGEKEVSPEEPAITVCVPVAILAEKEERAVRTIKLVSRAQQKLGEPVEVLLWTNARHKDSGEDKRVVANKARYRYKKLKTTIGGVDNPGLTIKTALQVLPESEATMSRLRANYMEAVAFDAVHRGYGFDHPILWLDADTTFLSSNSLRDIEKSVREFEAMFVHTNAHFSLDWLKDRTLNGMDDVSKAIALEEIVRRQIIRERRSDSHMNNYMEECGLAFALGVYLDAGGLNTADPINESSGLEDNIERAQDGYAWANDPANPHYPPHHPQKRIVPDFLRPSLGSPIRKEKIITAAHMGISARRHYAVVQKYGVESIGDYDDAGPRYELFSHLEEWSEEPEPIFTEDIRYVLGRLVRTTPVHTPAMGRRLQLVKKVLDHHLPPR